MSNINLKKTKVTASAPSDDMILDWDPVDILRLKRLAERDGSDPIAYLRGLLLREWKGSSLGLKV